MHREKMKTFVALAWLHTASGFQMHHQATQIHQNIWSIGLIDQAKAGLKAGLLIEPGTQNGDV